MLQKLRGARLYGEIALQQRDLFLARITVLGHQIAGVTGQLHIIDGADGSAAELDIPFGVAKMRFDRLSGVLTCRSCALDYFCEVLPFRIAHIFHQFSGVPEFHAILVLIEERV